MVPHADRIANARRVGAVFGQRSQLWWDLPARDSLTVLRDIHGISAADFRARIAEFDRILELSSFWDTRARQLSLGQRVRCDLAAALIHDPAALYLDEPTIGMDVVVKEQVRNFLRDQVEQRGRTVVLTTHDMTEVERLAERAVLIDQGRIVYDGDLETLRLRHQATGDQSTDLEDIMRSVFESQRAELAEAEPEPEATAGAPTAVEAVEALNAARGRGRQQEQAREREQERGSSDPANAGAR